VLYPSYELPVVDQLRKITGSFEQNIANSVAEQWTSSHEGKNSNKAYLMAAYVQLRDGIQKTLAAPFQPANDYGLNFTTPHTSLAASPT
jgi:hypothetical protein